MYSEILRIIEGGLNNDKRKIVSYSNRLANRFEKDGDSTMAKCILDVVNDVSRNGISTMDEFRNIPVDSESRMKIVEVIPMSVTTPMELIAGCTANNNDAVTTRMEKAENEMAVLWQSKSR